MHHPNSTRTEHLTEHRMDPGLHVIPTSTNCLFDFVSDDVLEGIIFFCQPFAEYQNTFGITRAIAPLEAMLVCRRWRDVIAFDPRLWTDVFVHANVDISILKLHLQRAGQRLPLHLWVTSGALMETRALDVILPHADRLQGIFLQPLPVIALDRLTRCSPTFGSQATMTDLQKWIGMPLPNLRYLHLGGLAINGHPPTVQLSLPNLEKLSFGMTVPRFCFPNSHLRYLGFISSLITMKKLSEYMMHSQDTLETLCLDGVTMTNIDAPEEAFPNLDMPCVTEMIIQIPGGDGFAEHLLTDVHYPQLRSLTFSASPGKRFGAWHRTSNGEIQLPNLEVLNFDSGVMPIGAFQDILRGAEGIRKLVMPRFGSQGHLQAAVDTLIAWSDRGGKEPSKLEEVVATALKPKQMVTIVEALPSLRTLVVSGSLEKRNQVGNSEHWRWLQEHVENLVWLEE